MESTTLSDLNLRICIDYHNHLLVSDLKPKNHSIPIKDYLRESYRYISLLLFLNFFNSLDNIKYKYFHGIKSFINKGKLYLLRAGLINKFDKYN